MVNYNSIKIGLEVEFMIEDQIFDGIVRYKGGINGYEGLWVGVEASQPSKYFQRYKLNLIIKDQNININN